jgi:hypothetical protein
MSDQNSEKLIIGSDKQNMAFFYRFDTLLLKSNELFNS